jgi:hypothetical protein
MDRARGLPPAKNVDEPRQDCIHAGRHGEPRQNHRRQQHKYDGQITQLLQEIVMLCRVAMRQL